ncbi:MAG: hypothetical protein EOP85_12370 [Verrucomicrobiaceae bacterium]|nr:MAG: hypothetical protein EOP85_12370 [Verrucomicrobiaceae bacterium]
MKYLIPLAIATTTIAAQAVEVRLQDCPAPVRATIESKIQGGKLDDIDKVTKNGTTRYIVDIDGPARRDVTFHLTPAGKVIFTSEDISLSQAPKAVRAAVAGLVKNGRKLDDIDRETTGGAIRFRVDIDRRNQADLEFLFSSKGKVLKRTVERIDD